MGNFLGRADKNFSEFKKNKKNRKTKQFRLLGFLIEAIFILIV